MFALKRRSISSASSSRQQPIQTYALHVVTKSPMLRGLYRTRVLPFLLVGFLLTQRAKKSAIQSEQIAKNDLQPSRGALIK